MESVGTDTGLVVISILIQLAVLGALGYGLYRLFRASRNNKTLRGTLIIIGITLLIVLLAALTIGYAYLGALGRGMSL